MRTYLLLLSGSLSLGAAAAIAACGSSSSGDAASPPIESDGGTFEGGPGAPDTGPPPAAQGDPCRGVPIPTDQHFVPTGMCARVVASNIRQLRQLTFAPNGDLFGTSSDGTIRLFRDEDGDGYFQDSEIHVFARTGGNGNNAHVDATGGFVYAGSTNGVKRFPYAPDSLSGGTGEDVVTGQPSGGHGTHTVHVYDGYLYVQSGSAGNATHTSMSDPDYDTNRSLIKRFALSGFTSGSPMAWSSGEPFTLGLRNTNGFSRNAQGRIYGVVNGLDNIHYQGQDVHNDNPGEQIIEIAQGKKYGYPFCFTAQRVAPGGNVITAGTQLYNEDWTGAAHDDGWCAANSSPPTTFIQAHSAPLDIVFFDGQLPTGALPDKYRGGAFVALHGSWNRGPSTGYKVIFVPFNPDGTAAMPTSTAAATTFPYEVVFGGGNASAAKDGAWAWQDNTYSDSPRPAGVAVSPIDGALYVASDSGGVLYRVGVQK